MNIEKLPYKIKAMNENNVIITDNINSSSKVPLEGTSLQKGKIGYRVVIKCTLKENGSKVYHEIEFDKINSINVNSSSDITTYPIAQGYYVGDHMYRNPATVSIDGTYSLYGSRPQNYEGKYNDRLTNVQDLFEKIKNQGVFCTISTLSRINNEESMYITRHNMVLNSIRWTQNQASLDFNFSFTEVMVVNTEEISSDFTEIDPDAPNPTDPKLVDFTDEVLDWNKVSNIIDKMMIDSGRAEPKFMDYYTGKMSSDEYKAYLEEEKRKTEQLGTAGGAVTGLAAGAASGAVVGSIIPVIGTTIGTIIGGLGGLLFGHWAGGNRGKAEAEQKVYDDYQFVLTNDAIKNESLVDEYGNFKSNVLTQIDQLEKAITCWSIPVNEAQQLLLYIDNNSYVFNISKNNGNGRWYVDISIWGENEENSGYKSIDMEGLAISDIGKCTEHNRLFKVNNGPYEVYLLNKKLNEIEANNLNIDQINDIRSNLTNYLIIISSTPLYEFNETLKQIIEKSLEW